MKSIKLVWPLLCLAAITLGVTIWFFASANRSAQVTAAEQVRSPQPAHKISSLGRIEPLDGIIRIAARSISGQPSIISELKVHEGDWVKAGQIVAVLDSRNQLEAAVRDLEARIPVAEQRLAVVRSGAKTSDITAGQAEIARLQAVLANALTDVSRFEQLYAKGSATIIERDRALTAVETTRQSINAANAKLAGLNEVRSSDVKLAEAEVTSARATVDRARSEVPSAFVRSPSAGRVIKVHAHKGEQVGPEGILELGRTDRMYAITEVFETDIGRVRVGQSATITGEALSQPLHGQVEYIGLQVAKDNIARTDPVSLSDARVVEVKVRLDEAPAAARLIHGQVAVLIEP
jgi:HlyD family secretion protein